MARKRIRIHGIVVGALAVLIACPAIVAEPTDADLEFFERSIRPILANRCFECHGPKEQESDLRLDHISFILEGGERGPALVPGDIGESNLVKAIEYTDRRIKMPPKEMMEDDEIDLLIEWVDRGAPWPDEAPPTVEYTEEEEFNLIARRNEHWAWRPVRKPKTPDVSNDEWPRTESDRFLLARLDEERLTPAPEADRWTLMRRLSFDLLGLPPDPERAERFVNDPRPDAYERLVDEMLASPHFGERWGRHWLDLVRYAESYGHEGDYPIREAWRYRDYVIRAFNDDVPYDDFVREHLAGDLLPDPRINPDDDTNESIRGTGWWYMHQATHAPVDVEADLADRVDNQIDVIGKAFLGMTVSCARCHDHKFDAISAEDYYSLGAFMRASRQVYAYLDPHGAIQETVDELLNLKAEGTKKLASALDQSRKSISDEVREYMNAATEVLRGTPTPRDRRYRGEPETFAGFEGDDFGNWEVEGEAFGSRPADGPIDKQNPVKGFMGGGLANSYHDGDDSTGVMTSPEFRISQPYIHLLVGGGHHPDDTTVKLIVDGHVVKSVTGKNSETLTWRTWDVWDFDGEKAQIVISDTRKGSWGHILADEIVFSGSPIPEPVARPVAAVARAEKLDERRLGRWVQALHTAQSDGPNHPLAAWPNGLAKGESQPASEEEVFETFDAAGFGDWIPAGFAFGEGFTQGGAWQASEAGSAFVPTGAAHSGLRSDKLHGTLRSPSFTLEHNTVHIRAKGRNTQIRLIVGHYMLREYNGLLFNNTFKDVNSDEYTWITMTHDLRKWIGSQAYFELVDDGDGYIAVDEIRFSNSAEPPAEPNDLPANVAEAGDAAAYADWTAQALGRWATEGLSTADAAWLDLLQEKDLVAFGKFEELRHEYAQRIDATVADTPAPIRVAAIEDGSVEPAAILIRGNANEPGDAVDRRFLEAIDGPQPLVSHGDGSGRLQLANRLVSEDNPLFARVIVNRVWHHLFGRGIVPSVDNFGVLGEDPSHPELLDHLATEFTAMDYSIKTLIRNLVRSSAYRMTSRPVSRVAEERDPNNVLLHRASLRRLDSEALRDAVLTASGTLNDGMFGPSVLAYLSPFNNNHRRPPKSGPMDGDLRRTIYLEVKRNFLPELQLTFDFPAPDSTVGRRTVSNVPAQSLALMNDAFIIEQAKAWGAEMAADDGSFAERAQEVSLRAWGRPATENEIAALRQFAEQQAATYEMRPDRWLDDARVWSDVCHAMFMTKAFLFVG